MRVVGLDLGTRRVGVASSDASGLIATPLTVVTRSGDLDRDRKAIAAIVAEQEAELVVVGLPVSLDGTSRAPAIAAAEEAAELASRLEVPVVTYDERLTTVVAGRLRREAGSRGGKRRRRRPIDAEAAAVILQSYLDSKRAAGGTG